MSEELNLKNPVAINQEFNEMVYGNPNVQIGDTSYNPDDPFMVNADNDYFKSIAQLSTQFDVLGGLSHDPEDPASVAKSQRVAEALNAAQLNTEDFSLDAIKAEIERRHAQAEAEEAAFERRRMTMDVIDRHIDKKKTGEEEDNEKNAQVIALDFDKKKVITKALSKAA